jgi:hypothetical protein
MGTAEASGEDPIPADVVVVDGVYVTVDDEYVVS